MTLFFSNDHATHCALPVLWMMSRCHIGHISFTVRLTAQGCQSVAGNAERCGASALQLPSLHCLPFTDMMTSLICKPCHTKEFGSGGEQCTVHVGGGSLLSSSALLYSATWPQKLHK